MVGEPEGPGAPALRPLEAVETDVLLDELVARHDATLFVGLQDHRGMIQAQKRYHAGSSTLMLAAGMVTILHVLAGVSAMLDQSMTDSPER